MGEKSADVANLVGAGTGGLAGGLLGGGIGHGVGAAIFDSAGRINYLRCKPVQVKQSDCLNVLFSLKVSSVFRR